MKKVLFILHSMRIGGIQKSLVSFLQCLVESEYAEQYELHILIQDPAGMFLSQIPPQIKKISAPKTMRWMGSKFDGKLFRDCFSLGGILGEASWIVRKRFGLFPEKLNGQQKLWLNWERLIPENEETYDVVVSYQDGASNYYAIDKVKASRKILWVHSEYQKLKYNPEFDRRYFEKCDAIVTISEKCRNCIAREFPQLSDKIHVLENITSPDFVLARGREGVAPDYEDSTAVRLLSVGRLDHAKGFDIAVEAAKLLREAGVEYIWLIVGDGPEHERLRQQIDHYGLAEHFRLLGAKENPYTYMKACDILVQPSRFEGKSIVLDEVKVFCKPIISTNYTTVYDAIEHGRNGWIVDMTPQALCEGIVHLIRDAELRAEFSCYLERQPKGNVKELEKYIQVMLR